MEDDRPRSPTPRKSQVDLRQGARNERPVEHCRAAERAMLSAYLRRLTPPRLFLLGGFTVVARKPSKLPTLLKAVLPAFSLDLSAKEAIDTQFRPDDVAHSRLPSAAFARIDSNSSLDSEHDLNTLDTTVGSRAPSSLRVGFGSQFDKAKLLLSSYRKRLKFLAGQIHRILRFLSALDILQGVIIVEITGSSSMGATHPNRKACSTHVFFCGIARRLTI